MFEALKGFRVVPTVNTDEVRMTGPDGLDVRVFPSQHAVGAHVVVITANDCTRVNDVLSGLRSEFPCNFLEPVPNALGGFVAYGRVGWQPTTLEVGHG